MANSCEMIGFNPLESVPGICLLPDFCALLLFPFVGWRRPVTPRAHCQTVWNIQDQGYKSWNFGETGGEPSHSFWRCRFFLHQHLPCNIQGLCVSQGSAGTSPGQVRATAVHNRGTGESCQELLPLLLVGMDLIACCQEYCKIQNFSINIQSINALLLTSQLSSKHL